MKKILTLLLTLSIGSFLTADIISINFGQPLNGSAGLSDLGSVVDSTGWNDGADASAGQSLFFSDGSTSAITTLDTVASTGGENQFFGPSYAANQGRLLNGAIMDYPTSAGGQSLTLSGMSSDFGSGYVAVVYLNGFAGNTESSISDGSTTLYWTNLADNSSFDGNFSQITNTSSSSFEVGQYALFGTELNPLTADTLTLTYEAMAGGGTGIAGVQLVGVTPVPEPSTYALFTGILVLGFVLRRRLRK